MSEQDVFDTGSEPEQIYHQRVELAVKNLQRAEQAYRDRLVAVESQLNTQTILLESIRREVIKLSKGMGVY